MSETQHPERWYVPKTTVGKFLLLGYLVSFVAVSLPLYNVAFNGPSLLFGMPEAVAWSYLWFGVMNIVLLGTYQYLLRPWAEQATGYMEGWRDLPIESETVESPGVSADSASGGVD